MANVDFFNLTTYADAKMFIDADIYGSIDNHCLR
jgi:hypothetical protein